MRFAMSEDLNKQLAELAHNLGVSVEHLWGVLIKQAYIDGPQFLGNYIGLCTARRRSHLRFLLSASQVQKHAAPGIDTTLRASTGAVRFRDPRYRTIGHHYYRF
jgi:hypothetical protein